MAHKKKKKRTRHSVAKDLRTPKYKMRVIPDKREEELRKLERKALLGIRQAMKAAWAAEKLLHQWEEGQD